MKYIDADRLKAKLDEHYRNYQSKYMETRTPYTQGLIDALDLAEQVIDSIESEKPMQKGLDVTGFCKPIDPGIAQCIADHSWEMLGEDEKPVPNDLEEAAEEMALRAFPEKKSYSTVIDRVVDYNAVDRKNYRDGIIVGAKWQAEKDARDMYMSDNRHFEKIYQLGRTDMREQLLKGAVEVDVNTYRDLAAGKSWAEFVVEMPTNNLGDKIRIIIVKEE